MTSVAQKAHQGPKILLSLSSVIYNIAEFLILRMIPFIKAFVSSTDRLERKIERVGGREGSREKERGKGGKEERERESSSPSMIK